MVHLDMTAPTGGELSEPGTYLVRVASVDERKSSSGEAMLNVKLVKEDGRRLLCYDNIMLGGGGWFIGHAKLMALGLDPAFSGEFDPQTIHNKRVWVEVVLGEYGGKPKLEVNIEALANKGYQHWSNTPPGHEKAAEEDSDTPF